MLEMRAYMRDLENKLKHMSVLSADIALTMVPQKLSGKFANVNDLNKNIQRRENLVHNAKILTNWIYKKRPQNNMFYSQITTTTINPPPLGSHGVSLHDLGVTKDSLEFFSQGSNPTPKIGRDPAVLSGSTSRRRDQTFNYLRETADSNKINMNHRVSVNISEWEKIPQNNDSQLKTGRVYDLPGTPSSNHHNISVEPMF